MLFTWGSPPTSSTLNNGLEAHPENKMKNKPKERLWGSFGWLVTFGVRKIFV